MQRPINSCDIFTGLYWEFCLDSTKTYKNNKEFVLCLDPTKKKKNSAFLWFWNPTSFGLPTNFLNLPVFCHPQLAIDPFDPWSAHGSSPRTPNKNGPIFQRFFWGLLSLLYIWHLFDTQLTQNHRLKSRRSPNKIKSPTVNSCSKQWKEIKFRWHFSLSSGMTTLKTCHLSFGPKKHPPRIQHGSWRHIQVLHHQLWRNTWGPAHNTWGNFWIP